jgi:predicted dehydrogenase
LSRDLAVGVVGLGFGAVHARVLNEMEGVRLAAICDSDPQRLAATARGRTAAIYPDYRAMLRDEALDAVIVAVPVRLHEEVALAVIAAGKALLVEKPLAGSLEEGRRIVEAAGQRGVLLTAGHIERFNPAVQELARRLQQGEAGRVLQVTARRLGPFAARTRDVSVVHDLALHDVDVMLHLMGREIEGVFAQTQAGVRTDSDDTVAGVIRFRDGPVGVIEVNWLTPRKVRELSVLGERGLFVLDYLAQTLEFYESDPPEGMPASGRGWQALATLRGGAGAAVRIPIEPREPLERELSAFVTALRDGTPPLVTPEDALAAVTVCDALAESARTGRAVVPRDL